MSNEDFFIGWSDKPPKKDRRAFLLTGVGLTVASAAAGFTLAKSQREPGNGRWDSAELEYQGVLITKPYPMLLTRALGAQPRTVLLACPLKCGVADEVAEFANRAVIVKGSLIERGAHAMIAVSDDAAWIREDSDATTSTNPPMQSQATSMGQVTLSGEILDSKCWFGAMRPGHGKTHKSCASLCIRGGVPPAFFVRGANNETAFMLLTENMRAFSMSLLPFVADPLQITGELFNRDGNLFLDTDPARFSRV